MNMMAARAESAAMRFDADSFEALVVACLEMLATLAREGGEARRAARLLEAADVLRGSPRTKEDTELSDREWEVAMLVARGLSNRQIAAELIVSERTIDTHVSHILRKLSLVSRAQIAAWAVQHRRQFRVLP
jgi:DNA-binding NarL/FixJ family response regulator